MYKYSEWVVKVFQVDELVEPFKRNRKMSV
jgi:hypothetical protein